MLILLLLALGGCVSFCTTGRVPLLEVSRTITSGSAYGFEIGMSRQQALEVARARYGDGVPNWSESRLMVADTWEIRAGDAWTSVNTIELRFREDRLTLIRRDRYLFERP